MKTPNPPLISSYLMLLLFCSSLAVFSQQQEATYYIGIKGDTISKQEFINQINYKLTLGVYYGQSMHRTGKIILREKIFSLAPSDLEVLYQQLGIEPNKDFSSDGFLFIQYFENDTQLNKFDQLERRLKWHKDLFKRLTKKSYPLKNIVAQPTCNRLNPKVSKNFEFVCDQEGFFYESFLGVDIPYGCFLWLHQSGELYIYYGETSEEQVWEGLLLLKKEIPS